MITCRNCGKEKGPFDSDSRCPSCGHEDVLRGTWEKDAPFLNITPPNHPCRHCGKSISASATQCPECKANPKSFNPDPVVRGDCFIATAALRSENLPDNCAELEIMRCFRDQYVKNVAGGQKLLDDYYRLAPTIVKRIESQKNSGSEYKSLLVFIRRSVSLIQSGKHRETLSLCVNKFEALKEKYKVH